MSDGPTVETLREALSRYGDARESGWVEFDPNYVADHSLTAEHIPALISLATEWVDEPPESDAVYVPVHAWRALGQLRAVEAVQPLLGVQDELDERGDDWYLEEFYHVFGLIGEPAIEALAAYLSDDSYGEFPRGQAASGLCEIAKHVPETRERCVAILSRELAQHHKDTSDFNGFLVHNLLNLDAVECAETIERAFAANVIDPTIVGDWCDVRQELGVTGLGIAPEHSPGWTSIRERLGFVASTTERRLSTNERKKLQDAKRKVRAKRKQKKKDRKRNRKPR